MSSFLVSPFCWARAICDNATRKPDKSPEMPPGTCANRCAWLPPRLMFQLLPWPSPFVPAGLVALSLVPANSRLFLRLTTTTFAWDAKPGNFVHLTLME